MRNKNKHIILDVINFCLFAVVITFCMCKQSAKAEPVYKTDYSDEAFSEAARKTMVPEDILRSVCYVESRHNPKSLNFDDAGNSRHAYGFCQILYTTAKQYGGVKDKGCLSKKFKNNKELRVYNHCRLFGIKTNILIAAKYLQHQYKRYGSWVKAIAAYNTGSYKECKTGWLYYKSNPWKRCVIDGPVNLYYIERVRQALGDPEVSGGSSQ